jgi:hypothetical protein
MRRPRRSGNSVEPCQQVWLASSLRPRIGVACLASKLPCFARNGSIWVWLGPNHLALACALLFGAPGLEVFGGVEVMGGGGKIERGDSLEVGLDD